jgi:hypothetical protein
MTQLTLKVATDEQADQCVAFANAWLATTRGHFGDAKTTAKFAVAEFLANQIGLTLYASRGEKQI